MYTRREGAQKLEERVRGGVQNACNVLELDALGQRIADFERSHDDQLISEYLFCLCDGGCKVRGDERKLRTFWRGCCFRKAGALELGAGHDATRPRQVPRRFACCKGKYLTNTWAGVSSAATGACVP
jgi:hypothetical protein